MGTCKLDECSFSFVASSVLRLIRVCLFVLSFSYCLFFCGLFLILFLKMFCFFGYAGGKKAVWIGREYSPEGFLLLFEKDINLTGILLAM